jgi:hypothetical protein
MKSVVSWRREIFPAATFFADQTACRCLSVSPVIGLKQPALWLASPLNTCADSIYKMM